MAVPQALPASHIESFIQTPVARPSTYFIVHLFETLLPVKICVSDIFNASDLLCLYLHQVHYAPHARGEIMGKQDL